MSRSTSSDRLGRWEEDDSNRPHKKPKISPARPETSVEDDADSSTKMSRSLIRKPESDSWVVTRYLGTDSYSSVYLAVRTTEEDEEDDLPHVMVIKSSQLSQAAYLMNEEKFLTLLESPFIVSCYGNEMTEEKNEKKKYFNTIHEYCPGQCLEKHVKGNKGGLPIDDVKRYASDILFGLKCIHGEEIIHCDIKPKNILLTPESKRFSAYGFKAKISGLGNAIEKGWIESGESWNHMSGTARFMSPELIGEMVLDYGADVWAFGCTVLEMLTGEEVWGEFGELDWEGWRTLIGESDLVPKIPDYLSGSAKEFVTKCLERDPSKRWSVDSLINHEFLKCNEEDEEGEETYDEEEEEGVYEFEEGVYEFEEGVYEFEEGEEDFYDELGDEEVEAYEAILEAEAAFKEEPVVIDEEYPEDDSEEEL